MKHCLDQDILAQLCTLEEYDEEEQDYELTATTEYKEKFRTTMLKADRFLDEKPSLNSSLTPDDDGRSFSSIVGHKKTYKLPKIEIKKINGDMKEWISFWSQFQKIHEDMLSFTIVISFSI